MADYVRRLSDVEYTDSGNPAHTLTLYLPVEEERFPLLILFPDLLFGEEGKESLDSVSREIAGAGIACAVADYRSFGTCTYYSALDDVANAITYLIRTRETLGDVSAIYVGGVDSGATAAMMMAFDKDRLRAKGVDPDHLDGFIFLGGLCSTHPRLLEDRETDPSIFTVDVDCPLFHLPHTGPPLLILGAEEDPSGGWEESALLAHLLHRRAYDYPVISHRFDRCDNRDCLHHFPGETSPFATLVIPFITGGMSDAAGY